MGSREPSSERAMWGASLIAAPGLVASSTFFWEGGEYGITGGTLLFLANVLYVPAFMGLFEPLREKTPRYAAWGLLVAIYGCASGGLFAFRDIYAAALGVSQNAELQAFAAHPLAFNLALFWSGPLFPLSLLALGIVAVRKEAVDRWVGVMICLGAIAFPLSRVSRVELVGHAADLLLLIPLAYLGWLLLTGRGEPQVR